MLRFAFNAVTLLSLLSFVLVAACCVRAQFASDFITRESPVTVATAGSTRSGVVFFRMDWPGFPNTPNPDEMDWRVNSRDARTLSQVIESSIVGQVDLSGQWLRFAHIYCYGTQDVALATVTGFYFIHLPYWLLLLLCVPLPMLWLMRRRSSPQRRRRLGLCPACGYDLRGSPTGPCPECGIKRGETKPASA